MDVFWIDPWSGRVATRKQLAAAGLVDEIHRPLAPWHPISGPNDASTLWYAVMRKRIRGVFIGMLCIRHTSRQASLEAAEWEEVPVERIGPDEPGADPD